MQFNWSESNDAGRQMLATPVMGEFQWGRRVKSQPVGGFEDSYGSTRNTDIFEGNPDTIPSPSRAERWGGICRFLPMRWAEDMRERFAGLDMATPLCLSCHRNLIRAFPVLPHNPAEPRAFYVQPVYTTGVRALAIASDHDRTCLNHQIVVVDGAGNLLARSPYSPLAMSW